MRSSDYKRVCANCKWWVPRDEEQCREYGYCHRYPPTIYYEVGGCEHVNTASNDWCAEFAIMQHPRIAAAPPAKFANASALALGA